MPPGHAKVGAALGELRPVRQDQRWLTDSMLSALERLTAGPTPENELGRTTVRALVRRRMAEVLAPGVGDTPTYRITPRGREALK